MSDRSGSVRVRTRLDERAHLRRSGPVDCLMPIEEWPFTGRRWATASNLQKVVLDNDDCQIAGISKNGANGSVRSHFRHLIEWSYMLTPTSSGRSFLPYRHWYAARRIAIP